ncbi:MAG: DUF4153 domain-containing protein [Hyphomonadaceae bacterium]|jgi:hypothetical protein
MDRLGIVKRHGFLVKLATAAILVLMWDWMFWQQGFGLGNFGLFGLALLTGLIVVRPTIMSTREGIGAVIASGIYCSAIFLHGSLLSFVLFWTAISIAALIPFSGHLKDGWQWFGRLAFHGVASPFSPLTDAGRIAKARKRSPKSKLNVRAILRLLALPVLGGGVFLALFVQANPVLEHLFAQLSFPAINGELFGRTLIGLLIGTLIWTLFRPWRRRGPRAETPVAALASFKSPALASLLLSLLVFNGLFLMQNGMDLAFMSGLVPLPDDLTLAQYAHRGAYPLIITALLAGLFVLVLMSPGSEAAQNGLARRLVSAWIGQNVLLVTSSIIRTWDYVEAYSLTEMRIAALAWMVLVGFGLALICWRLLSAKSGSWLINANLWAVGLVLTGFCFVDTRTLAAQWNVTHAKEAGGRGVELDLCYMGTLGSGAILPLVSLEQRPVPAEFQKRVRFVRETIQRQEEAALYDRAWTWSLNHNVATAQQAVASLPPLDLGPGDRGCDGKLIADSMPNPASTYNPQAAHPGN